MIHQRFNLFDRRDATSPRPICLTGGMLQPRFNLFDRRDATSPVQFISEVGCYISGSICLIGGMLHPPVEFV